MFYARVIQVLITSPSDVPKSIIENVIESINDWNKINSESRRIMLKPVRWETDVYASLNNKEPQHIINTQIVLFCTEKRFISFFCAKLYIFAF